MKIFNPVSSLACLGLFLLGCSGGSGAGGGSAVAPAPAPVPATTVTITQGAHTCLPNETLITYPGQKALFQATVSGASNQAVTWTTTIGSIDSLGTFTAPTTTGNGRLTATSAADPTQSAAVNLLIQEQLQGAWNGTFHSSATGQSFAVTALTESGGACVLGNTAGLTISGALTVSKGNVLNGTGTVYTSYVMPDGATIGAFSCTGTLSTRTRMSGTYTAGGDSGTFTLTYDSTFDSGVSLAKLAGTWSSTLTSTGAYTTLTVAADGSFAGSDYAGTLTGRISVPDPSQNLYEVTATYTRPGYPLASYTGLGITYPASNTTRMVLTGPSGAFAGSFYHR